MITKKEIEAVELSPTKRDFYQIWNELIDTASKLSNRWDPSSTNESDPGIVLLKVLTAVADKLNYTIDKNVLEAFMPSAAQEESMRKLCDMMGYSMKYYRSATCPVRIAYVGTDYDLDADGMTITVPKYTNLKNPDEDVNYVTLEADTLDGAKTYITVDAIEGEHVSYDPITRDQLDDDHRYYLPEAQIAENGIFLAVKDEPEQKYEKVDNLNSQDLGTRCWKFGYDSREGAPYIEFPSDIDSIIGNGISFDFIRTNGANGNLAASNLSKIDVSSISLSPSDGSDAIDCEDGWLTVTNTAASTNGADKETMDDAYDAYKKTIGTFDTLVTCRDYMNKIYSLTEGDIDGSSSTTPLVSNVIVSDIRDDMNRAATICTFGDKGIEYKNVSKKDSSGADLIDHFDLMVYPFRRVYSSSKASYKNSFACTNENLAEIKAGIADCKTMSHDVRYPDSTDLACIKDMVKVSAKITTTRKVTTAERTAIVLAVRAAIYKTFNMRKVDFGEKISDEAISKAIIAADSRIKNVALTTYHDNICFQDVGGNLYEKSDDEKTGLKIWSDFYLKAVEQNVLAGRVALFDYDDAFEPSLSESISDSYKDLYYPKEADFDSQKYGACRLDPKYEPQLSESALTLNDNEVIQFRTPSMMTEVTYPAYVNYYFYSKSSQSDESSAQPATFMTLYAWLNDSDRIDLLVEACGSSLNFCSYKDLFGVDAINEDTNKQNQPYAYEQALGKYCWLFSKNDSSGYIRIKDSATYDKLKSDASKVYLLPMSSLRNSLAIIQTYVNSLVAGKKANGDEVKYSGLWKSMGIKTTNVPGKQVDVTGQRFAEATSVVTTSSSAMRNTTYFGAYDSLYVQDTSKGEENYFGLGVDGELDGIAANEEYQLQSGEYLFLNWTSTTTDDSGTETSSVVNKVLKAGDIIKPNFKLSDSGSVHSLQSTSYSKKTGFAFSEMALEGMFTMDANQQIELRKIAKVNLGPDEGDNVDASTVNVFWVRQDDDGRVETDQWGDKSLTFDWDEDFIYVKDAAGNYKNDGTEKAPEYVEISKDAAYDGQRYSKHGTSYTLKENEYFFYTDKNKTDMTYYGNGTKVHRSNESVVLTRSVSDDAESEIDDILQNGLGASIQWVTKRLDKTNTIELYEYKVVSLTKGDTLVNVNNLSSLSRDWQTISSASYKLTSQDKDAATQSLPTISFDGGEWQARSLLQVNMGPKLMQTLHQYDSIAAYRPKQDYVDTSTGLISWTSTDIDDRFEKIIDFKDISLKASALIQSSAKYVVSNAKLDVQLKAFVDNSVSQTLGNAAVDFGNYGDGITTVGMIGKTSADDKSSKDSLDAYVTIPEADVGMLMIYARLASDGRAADDQKSAFLTATAYSYDETTKKYSECKALAEFKSIDVSSDDIDSSYADEIEWQGDSMKVLLISNSAKKITISVPMNVKVSASVSNLDLIKRDNGTKVKLNPQLGLDDAADGAGKDLLESLKSYDGFYYNLVQDSSSAMTFGKDETMQDADLWYDVNNVCSKFVVAEIDADYLEDSGVVIDAASKQR